MIWFALGLLVSAYNMQSIRRFVNSVSPQSVALQSRVIKSFLLRYVLNAALLLIAVQFGLREALFAFAGLWMYRWIFILRVHRTGGMTAVSD